MNKIQQLKWQKSSPTQTTSHEMNVEFSFAIDTIIAQISRALKWGWKPHMKITIQLPLLLDSSKHTFYALTPKKIEFLYEKYQKYAVV